MGKSVADGKASVASAITNKGVSTASDASFSTMATNISKISSSNIGATLLWTNPSPTSKFAGGTAITISGIHNYKWILIEAISAINITNVSRLYGLPLPTTTSSIIAYRFVPNIGPAFERVVTVSTNTISFAAAYSTAAATTPANDHCIPTRIWGINSL